jgi:hypothetical protein
VFYFGLKFNGVLFWIEDPRVFYFGLMSDGEFNFGGD